MSCWSGEHYPLSFGFDQILTSVHDWSCHDYYTDTTTKKVFKEENKNSRIEVLFQPHASNQNILFQHVDSGFSEDQSNETCDSATESPSPDTEEFQVDCDTATILSSAIVQDEDQLMEVMKTRTDFRVYFLTQKNSFRQLRITESLFKHLVDVNRIFPKFREVLIGFGDKQTEEEVGPPAFTFRLSRPSTGQPCPGMKDEYLDLNTGFECSYALRFVERPNRPAAEPWSLRQTDFYHQYNCKGISKSRGTSTWILMGSSDMPKVILELYCRRTQLSVPNCNPLELHVIFLDMAISTWRPYMIDLERRVSTQSDKASVAETHEDFLSLNDEQKLHYLELRLLDIILCMDSTSHTVGQMTEMYNQYLWVIGGASIGDVGYAAQTDGILLALRQQAAEVGYIRKKAEALVAKCKESRNLTSRFLELQTALALKKIQTDTQQESKSMHDLTKKGHSDSKSLKVLSIITLVYLPATIIMSFYSTQFVQYDDDAGKLRYTGDWWLFLVVSVPITLFTVGIWYFFSRRYSRKYHDEKPFGEEQGGGNHDVERGK